MGKGQHAGKAKGNAQGFKLSGLMAIVVTKGGDSRTTLLDFLVDAMMKEGHAAVTEVATSLASLSDRSTKTHCCVIQNSFFSVIKIRSLHVTFTVKTSKLWGASGRPERL